jgi:hypothetical protein
MSGTQTVNLEALRSLPFGSIGATYTAIGTPLIHEARMYIIDNNTDGDLIFSFDGVTDELFVAAGAFKLFDFNTNRLHVDQKWVLPIGTQIYVKYSTAPTKKSVYVMALYGG